jgi:hypothetical protein
MFAPPLWRRRFRQRRHQSCRQRCFSRRLPPSPNLSRRQLLLFLPHQQLQLRQLLLPPQLPLRQLLLILPPLRQLLLIQLPLRQLPLRQLHPQQQLLLLHLLLLQVFRLRLQLRRTASKQSR